MFTRQAGEEERWDSRLGMERITASFTILKYRYQNINRSDGGRELKLEF